MSNLHVNLEHSDSLLAMARNSQVSLEPSEIHLWVTHYDEIVDPALLGAYRGQLNSAEREQEPRFHFVNDRKRYLVTRALVRTVLSRYACIDPKSWTFSKNDYGRPEIANEETESRGLSFNISHTQGLIVLGVTSGRALGVDVENVVSRQFSLSIAEDFFAPDEATALSAIEQDQQQFRFFEYWTFKESYIKARGMGLSIPLDKFSFNYEDSQSVALTVDPELGDSAARWQFWQLRPTSDHVVAICAERIAADATHVIVRQIVPMVGETMMEPELKRTSQ